VDAKAGNADAQYWVARCQEYGVRNLKEARKWYFKSADAGNPKAMFKAAWFAAKRLGVEGMAFDESRKLAIRYAKAASEAGNADGTAMLAWLEFIDCNALRDFESALPMIRKAVDENSSLGKTMLGRMYIDGTGVKRDLAKAEQLLQEAVDQGYSEAQDSLMEVRRASGKSKSAMKNDASGDPDRLSSKKLTPE
jgi:TPR repeat protein